MTNWCKYFALSQLHCGAKTLTIFPDFTGCWTGLAGRPMAMIFNQSQIPGAQDGHGAKRQRLLTAERVPGTAIRLDRLTIAAGGHCDLTVPPGSVAWLQMLSGSAALERPGVRDSLTEHHVACLPPGLTATLTSTTGAILLFGEVPDAARLDPKFASQPPALQITDWSREPVLDSQHDARKRIYLVTPKLSGTRAIKGEMIFYPPGTAAANHHHEGAEHFMYVLRGRGTVYASEQPHAVRTGDIIYYPDRERHYLEAAPDSELVFAEFFAPGEFVTVWVDASQVCTWLPTGRDIRGQAPARAIKGHSSADVLIPQDI
jgi:quercetin dioxygenase-like cupin family protein